MQESETTRDQFPSPANLKSNASLLANKLPTSSPFLLGKSAVDPQQMRMQCDNRPPPQSRITTGYSTTYQ
jgi:hypothetical protein